jgi:uncharacterized membrane protein (DUF2068 family)
MAVFPHRVVHFSLDILHARTETKRIIRRLVILFAATVVATLICALALYLLERHAHDSEIKSYGLAVFSSASQLLILGSSLADPVTTTGRIITVAMDVYAVVVIGTISGLWVPTSCIEWMSVLKLLRRMTLISRNPRSKVLNDGKGMAVGNC